MANRNDEIKEEWWARAPKVELHCHLDGSLSLETVRTLADLAGISLPGDDGQLLEKLQAAPDCDSLMTYLEKFDLPLSLLQTEQALELAAYSLVKDAASEGVIYLEVRFAPLLHLKNGLTCDQVVESVIRGLKKGEEETKTRAAALLCAMRHEKPEHNLPLVACGSKYLGKGVCGLDMAGDELHFPPLLHKDFFDRAREAGLPFTIHAGECGSAENVRDSLLLGAKRVGHGIALKNDPEIRRMALESGCGIEMCPTSNLQTKAVSSWDGYPFSLFWEEGLCVTVNTDNRMVSGTTMNQELGLLHEKFGLNREMVKKLAENGVRAAFADEATKRELYERIEKYWKNN